MVKFNKIYFLQYLINILVNIHSRGYICLLDIKTKSFKNFIKRFNFTEVICLKEKRLMGTGGALLNLKKFKMNDFYTCYGDTVFDIDLTDFFKSYKSNTLGCLAQFIKKKIF